MRRLVVVFALVAVAMGTCLAQDTAVMAKVNQFVDAFNKGETRTAAAVCADQAFIIDDFPPHAWHGTGACARWMNDYDRDARKNGIADGHVTLGSPRHVEVTADRAYVVVPAEYTYQQKGTPVKETGSILTLALRKGSAGWRITAWSWAKN
jgi:ketosteroid isomerase-like protein